MPLETYWEKYGDTGDFEEIFCQDQGEGSLAYRVLDYYEIPQDSSNSLIGGELPNLDIKQMDALQVIRSSLLEHTALGGDIWEPIVNGYGEVIFQAIGTYASDIEGHIYYEVQTKDYVEKCSGVMITGGKPLTIRKPVDWTPVWGGEADYRPPVYEMDIPTTNCMKGDYSQYAILPFPDPHFDTAYKDGIDNLYETLTPHEQIVGWAYYKDPGSNATKDTELRYSNSSEIPIRIGGGSDNLDESGATSYISGPDMGTLMKQPTYPIGDQEVCWSNRGVEGDYSNGIPVSIPSDLRYENVRGTRTDAFVDISAVYLIGRFISDLDPFVREGQAVKETTDPDDIQLRATIDDTADSVYKLTQGTQYVVAYDPNELNDKDSDITPYIVFGDQSRRNDPTEYGQGKTIYIEPYCRFAKQYNVTSLENVTIFPIAQTRAIMVKQIWVVAKLDTPSIVVFDPNGEDNRAYTIANELTYNVSPIVIVDEPPPIAFNGQLLDLTQSYQDNDPTTQQDFSLTELEQAMDIMNGGGVNLSLSFLDAEGCEKLSSELYAYMNSLGGVETTYVCGPECDPKLGGYGPNGGIINSIQYSYTDSGSYVISATEGPRIAGGWTDVTGGVTQKAVESVKGEGVIIEDQGNHTYFKVRIDGFGERLAINCCPSILRIGDRVSCSIHNNPVES